MNTQSWNITKPQTHPKSKWPLNRDEVFATMDIFFDTMEARWVTDQVVLYNQAKEYALKAFWISEELGKMLSSHEWIIRLLADPKVRDLNQKLKQSNNTQQGNAKVSVPPRPETVIQAVKTKAAAVSVNSPHPIKKTEPTVTQNDQSSYVIVPVDTASTLPDIDEAFRSGDMGLIARLLGNGHHEVEQVSIQGWGRMTTLPPPVDTLIGKIIHPDSLKSLLDTYNKTSDFQPVSEIRKLQDGDVVNFKKLQRSNDGKHIQHFRIIKINEVKTANNDYEIHCIANCVFIKDEIAFEVVEAQLRIRVPNTGLKQGTLLRAYTDGWEFFQAKIDGQMSVFTNDTRAFKGGFLSPARFVS